MKYDIVALYGCIDNFSKIYEEWEQKKLIGATKNRKREGKLSMSEKIAYSCFYIISRDLKISNITINMQ